MSDAYREIGKMFENVKFNNGAENIPENIPEGWELDKVEVDTTIEFMEIDFDGFPDTVNDVNEFNFIKKSQVETKYRFKRKE